MTDQAYYTSALDFLNQCINKIVELNSNLAQEEYSSKNELICIESQRSFLLRILQQTEYTIILLNHIEKIADKNLEAQFKARIKKCIDNYKSYKAPVIFFNKELITEELTAAEFVTRKYYIDNNSRNQSQKIIEQKKNIKVKIFGYTLKLYLTKGEFIKLKEKTQESRQIQKIISSLYLEIINANQAPAIQAKMNIFTKRKVENL